MGSVQKNHSKKVKRREKLVKGGRYLIQKSDCIQKGLVVSCVLCVYGGVREYGG